MGIGTRIDDTKPFRQRSRTVIESTKNDIDERQCDGVVLGLGKIGAVVKTMQLRSNEQIVKPSGTDLHIAMRNQGLEGNDRTEQ